MTETTTLFIGLDVYKESIAVAHASADHSSEVVYVGQIGTREADLDKLLRRLHTHASRLVVARHALNYSGRANWNDALLRRLWSPEQIAGRLRKTRRLSISHETIYRHVWNDLRSGGTLHQHLRGARKQRRKRYGAYDSRGRLAAKRHISERPPTVDNRRRIGHWEIDIVMGTGPDCLVSVVERKTGYVLIGKLEARTQTALTQRTVRFTLPHAPRVLTITADNGTEFHDYKSIERATGVRFYFATPHHAWERGTNENTNGLIRQYVPKGTSMAALTQSACTRIAETLNARPRKRLNYRTPQECFDV